MLTPSSFVKLRVVVPVAHAAAVRAALAASGAGVQGNYDSCSFSYPVTGRFRPLPGAVPAIGVVGEVVEVGEEVVETICHESKVKEAVDAVKKVHPYEEPAIDIIPRLEIQ